MGGFKLILTAVGLTFFAISCSKSGVNSDRIETGDLGGFIGASNGGGQSGDSTLDAGKITAGEWNDLSNWGFWEGLLVKPDFKNFPSFWSFNTNSRISVLLKNEQGFTIVDEPLVLLDANGQVLAETRTDNMGTAEFFPFLNNLFKGPSIETLQLKVNQQLYSGLKNFNTGINELVISKQHLSPANADIAFVVDATGSMGDEISYLKTELEDVINRVQSSYGIITVNTAAVFYRDEGDAYVTRKTPFSAVFSPVLEFIKDQNAEGGGDTPEAVHTALKESIDGLNWSKEARARILFLILDAPPHYEPAIMEDLHKYIASASKKGIRIIPITASGLEKDAEFLMRYFSIATNGTYVFITNHSGLGNDHLEASVGQYDVEYLNNLMVRLIGKYLQ